jgi:hypothetical protein
MIRLSSSSSSPVATAANAEPPSYSDNDIHRHQLDGLQVDATLGTVPTINTESRLDQCKRLFGEFCSVNGVAHLVTIDNDRVEYEKMASAGYESASAAVYPYGLLYITANQMPSAAATRTALIAELKPEWNVHIVISECRLYPTLVEAVAQACPRIRYWDALNSIVLSPRVMSTWQTLAHLNTLKLSLLNSVDRHVCRAQLMHWHTNHLQRLLLLGDSKHHADTELSDAITTRYPYLVHFANLALYTPMGAYDGTLVHITSPSYTVHPKPWARCTAAATVYDDELAATTATLNEEFHRLQIQVIGAQALVAEVCV